MKGFEQSWSHLEVNFLNHEVLLENHVCLLDRQIVVDFTAENYVKIVLKVLDNDCRQIIDVCFDPSALESHVVAIFGRPSEVHICATLEPEVKNLVHAWKRIEERLQLFTIVADYHVQAILNNDLDTFW